MKDFLKKYLTAIEKLGGDCRPLIFGAPANERAIAHVEHGLGYRLPPDFRKALLTTAGNFQFKWFLPEDFVLPNQLKGIFCGDFHWDVQSLLQINQDKDEEMRVFYPDPLDDYDKIWHNKFVFQEVGNGDYLSLDLTPDNYGKVIYLSHDDEEGNGYVMATSFESLLTSWTKLGCVGGEDWQWIPFCESKTSGINPECANAQLWYTSIGIS